MHDMVGVLDRFQEEKVSIHLVETSDSLILEQERTLCTKPSEFLEGLPHVRYNKTRSGIDVYWYRSVDDVPDDRFSVFVANEFLDALPIHQFRRNEKGSWSEVYVNLDSKGQLCFMLSKSENLHTKGLIPESVRNDKTLEEWEISPASGTFVNQIAERMCSHGGFALLVDYGHNNDRKDLSLRAYHNHKVVSPLERCGEQDLTADVNFGHLKSLVEDRTKVFGPVDQREFLAQMGIGIRLRKLVEQLKTRDQQEALIKSYNMLMSEEGMGTKFKAMAMYPRTLENILQKRGGPAGFASNDAREAETEEK
uniref:Protein arginine methyltransferase NDUFAF7 n=1 Tax=Steinernema glaseri TaxID=37863 RepID=A0A1I8A2I7_9BILA